MWCSQLSPPDDNVLKQHKEVLQKGRHGARKTTIAVTTVREGKKGWALSYFICIWPRIVLSYSLDVLCCTFAIFVPGSCILPSIVNVDSVSS